MKKIVLFCFLFFSIFSISQNNKENWKKITSTDLLKNEKLDFNVIRETSVFYSLDFTQIETLLNSAPKRDFNKRQNGVLMSFPNAEGSIEEYEVFEASNFDDDLQALFPEIRAYVGVGITNKYARIRISKDAKGITAYIKKPDAASEFIEPLNSERTYYGIFKSDRIKNKIPFTCSTSEEIISEEQLEKLNSIQSSSGSLLTFRLAMSVTPEYTTIQHARLGLANAKTSALSAINTTMSRVNGVFETDFAIHMNLVNNMTIIYDGSVADPYGATDTNYNSEVQSTLTSIVGEANYDVGHLMGGIGGNGNAGCIGCVCTNNQKGSGFTTSTVPYSDTFDIDYVAHELGHQFGANHTFSHASESTGVNKEVGSGVTIMGYAGITPYDTHAHSIDVFHSASIAQVQANMVGKTCPTTTPINHFAPVVNAGVNITIPRSTPFTLTGSATDAGGGSSLTYTWEQNDNVGTQTAANSGARVNKTTGPNWVNYVDSASGQRNFPVLSTTLANSQTTSGLDVDSEALNNSARTLNFRLTARDNILGIGQTNFDDMVVTVDGTRGPLDVTSQASTGINYQQGSTQTVTWNVNSTNSSSGGANVDILLSTDGGQTFPILLASNTSNDGTEDIMIPNVFAPNCRIMVKANPGIFYDINTNDFAIGYNVSTICNSYTANPAAGFTANNPLSYDAWAVNVPDDVTISDVNVSTNITHTRRNQLYTAMQSPNGTFVALFQTGGCGNVSQNLVGTWDDESATASGSCNFGAGTMQPVGNLGSLDGESSLGNWIFAVADVNADTRDGVLNSFTFEICSQQVAETPIPCGQISTTWNGSSWSNGAPLRNVAVTFTGNYTSTSNLEACSVTVTNGAQVTINPGHTLIVGGDVTVDSGSTLTIENEGALRQIDDSATNSGDIVVKRVSSPMIRLDYTAWSSPVSSQQLQAFSPNTVATRFYEYLYTGTTTPTAYQSVTPTNNFTAGKGYMIRVDNTWSSTIASSYNGQFTGVAHNGVVNQSIGTGYNLLGNPYASPLDADTFLADNTSIGTLYFWTNTTPAVSGSYPQNNFAAYTTLGGSAAFASGKVPNGTIQTGQGFYVQTSAADVAVFNNAQRVDAVTSTQFFKTTKASTAATNTNVNKHRIWLNLNDNETAYNQILVGYMDGATNGVDNMIDGKTIDTSKTMLYSVLNSEEYVIQGKATPFSDDDTVALGFKAVTAGNYSIGIENFDGLFSNQDIYLKDNQMNIVHDLKQGVYQFTSQAGDYKDRFEIVYKTGALAQESFENEYSIEVYSNPRGIQIQSSEIVEEVTIFDVLGRTLYTDTNTKSNQLTITSIKATKQALIVKVKDIQGNTKTEKIIY